MPVVQEIDIPDIDTISSGRDQGPVARGQSFFDQGPGVSDVCQAQLQNTKQTLEAGLILYILTIWAISLLQIGQFTCVILSLMRRGVGDGATEEQTTRGLVCEFCCTMPGLGVVWPGAAGEHEAST